MGHHSRHVGLQRLFVADAIRKFLWLTACTTVSRRAGQRRRVSDRHCDHTRICAGKIERVCGECHRFLFLRGFDFRRPTFGRHHRGLRLQAIFYIGGAAPLVVLFALVLWLPESISFLALNGTASPEIARILRRITGQAFPTDARFRLSETTLSGFTVRHLFAAGRAGMTLLLWVAFLS